MYNILDYVAWRGDIPFSVDAFNAIDALVLCQIAYIDVDGLLDSGFRRTVTLAELAERLRSADDFERRSDMGALINKLSVRLLLDAAASYRFGGIKVCGCRSLLDSAKGEQFFALTFLTEDGYAFVAYRGTDDTIVGWKEDFNMAVLDTVPAQADALAYLGEAMKSVRRKFRVGGHSKGGNLAVYAGAMLDRKYRNRVRAVFNLDGPGFRSERIDSAEFQSITPKLHSFYPQFSIVGMLFSHVGAYTVVESEQSGIMQHDPFSWHLGRTGFVALPGFDGASEMFHKTFNTWVTSISDGDRAVFVETLFNVLEATGARTNSELEGNWLKSSARMLKALAGLDAKTREQVVRVAQLLFHAAKINISWKSN